MRPAIKFLLGSSSGSMRKMADFFEAKSSALMALSKQRTCSSSVSRKALRRDRTVDIAEVNRLVKQFEQMKKMMKQLPGMMGGKRRGGLGGLMGKMKLPF